MVLGMGRSGTSMVTSMLLAAGFYAGRAEDLMPPDPGNPRGYGENLRVYRTNEEILQELDATWFAPPPEEQQRAARGWAVARLSVLVETLLDEADGAPLALKDPRIGVMLPLWEPVIGERLHPILVVRNPVEIATSLDRREQMPIPFALAAWELHMTAVLRHLSGHSVTVAPHELLLRSPEAASGLVRAAAECLAERHATRLNPTAAAEVVDQSLHRNRVDPREHRRHLTVLQTELWDTLQRLAPGNQILSVPDALLADNTAARKQVKSEWERKRTLQRLAQLEAAAGEAQRQLRDALGREAQLEGRVVALSADLARMAAVESDLVVAQQRLERVLGSKSWRMTSPLREFVRRWRI